LRVQVDEPTPPALEHWMRLFEAGVREARRAGTMGCSDDGQATEPGLFTPSVLSDEAANAH
jgi:hypothetical protein